MRERWPHMALATALVGVLATGCASQITPDDPEVQAWADTATADLSEDVAASAELVAAALPAGTTAVATVSQVRCTVGQHNFKIDDPFDVSCTATSGVLLRVAPSDDPRAGLVAVDGALEAAGWRAPVLSARQAADEYGDSFGRPDYRRGRDGEAVAYGPQHLPSLGYRHADDQAGLGLVFTGPDETSPDLLLYPGGVVRESWRATDGDAIEARRLPGLLTTGAYGILVVQSEERAW